MKIEEADVLVIGSGGAGLRAAIEIHDSGVDVLVVGKCAKRDAHTILATGGINASLGNMDSQDSWQLHAADTIKDGGHINDTDAVLELCKNAPYAVRELEKWGTSFHKEKNGKISQRFFGAATYRRACFVGDVTGKAILNTLVDQAEKRKINFRSEVYIFSLLHANGKVNGALGLDIRNGKFVIFHAKKVILATGGHSRMFARSSSRFWENNGDGISLAYNLGARFMDMEMFQFHPTGMVYPSEAEGVLVTEAVRGEGGILTNTKGERFMDKYDKERMELSARDIVARAIYNEVQEGRGTTHGGVWLDISHKPKSYILKRLPKMYDQFKKFVGIDISKEKMEVAPTAHYSMGGIYTRQATGETSVPGLFAIGEVTSGVHGANRLGGNSLAEIVVFGRIIGKNVARQSKKDSFIPIDDNLIKKEVGKVIAITKQSGKNPIDLKKEIQKVMWKDCGVVREGKKMNQALSKIDRLRRYNLHTGNNLKMNEKLIAALDVRNMFPTCEMILRSALFRKESRGAHYRSDYPYTKREWKNNVVCLPENNKIKVSTRPVTPVPKYVSRHFKDKNPSHHLLE
ncbi:FAD-binding protein [Candidatus Pacearchaeota archaeon]|nr:FAD-binding protein [Candidatus Pacearchaeota archaeon]